ncbi:hypothetical protein ABN028_35065 [Actinopolymorpha sp. B17G11]|uniref:hypothetical protein n=1 Tax=Actinopolymorpha sp. B17G11 TaxID=3160861 RepID=UPI0032E53019
MSTSPWVLPGSLARELFDVPALTGAATEAGRETLVELIAGLAERGQDPGSACSLA